MDGTISVEKELQPSRNFICCRRHDWSGRRAQRRRISSPPLDSPASSSPSLTATRVRRRPQHRQKLPARTRKVYRGTGEKYDALEAFYPDRIVSRVLRHGRRSPHSLNASSRLSITSIKPARNGAPKCAAANFSLRRFHMVNCVQIKKMGPLESVLSACFRKSARSQIFRRIPQLDEGRLRRIEAIINSMTNAERDDP